MQRLLPAGISLWFCESKCQSKYRHVALRENSNFCSSSLLVPERQKVKAHLISPLLFTYPLTRWHLFQCLGIKQGILSLICFSNVDQLPKEKKENWVKENICNTFRKTSVQVASSSQFSRVICQRCKFLHAQLWAFLTYPLERWIFR